MEKTVAVGSNDISGDQRGHVWVFRYDDDASDWSLYGPRIDGIAAGSLAGWAVALSGDASALVIGAPGYILNGGDRTGQVGIYNFSPDDQFWYRSAPGITADNPDDQFGYAVSVSKDGGTLIAGAPYTDDNGFSSGSAEVYRLFSRACLANPPRLPEDENLALTLAPYIAVAAFLVLATAVFACYWLCPRKWWNERIFKRPTPGAEYEFFISHCGPDTKDSLARPLKYMLERLGASAFFDEENIKAGEKNDVEMARGLYSCQYGVAIISDHFLDSRWCRRELKTLYERSRMTDEEFKLLVFFQSDRLIDDVKDFKRVKSIGATVRKSGYSDRQHLLNQVVPVLDANHLNLSDGENVGKARAASYITILNDFCAKKDITVPPSLRDPSDPSSIQSRTDGRSSRAHGGLEDAWMNPQEPLVLPQNGVQPRYPRAKEAQNIQDAQPAPQANGSLEDSWTNSQQASVLSWNASQPQFERARDSQNPRPPQPSRAGPGDLQRSVPNARLQRPASSYRRQSRQDIPENDSTRRDPPLSRPLSRRVGPRNDSSRRGSDPPSRCTA